MESTKNLSDVGMGRDDDGKKEFMQMIGGRRKPRWRRNRRVSTSCSLIRSDRVCEKTSDFDLAISIPWSSRKKPKKKIREYFYGKESAPLLQTS